MADTAATTLTEFRMPSLGSDMDEGTVLGWRIAPGDPVRKGDVLLDVDTDKSEIEVEIWHDGVVAEILVPPGTTVPVGRALAMIDTATGAAGTTPAPATPPLERAAPEPEAPERTPAVEATPVERPPAHAAPTPAPERPARLVTPRTVYWPSPPAAPAAPAAEPTTARARGERMRSAIANIMSRANREIPHYHLIQEVDLDATTSWLETVNEERSVADRILPAAVFVRAVALAAAEHPELNGHWIDDAFEAAESVNIGIAVHLRTGGLVSPAIAAAETKTIETLMAELRDLVGRARAGKLRQREMTSASITLTNLGDQGADAVMGVIHPPQVALVGIGRTSDRPTVVDGVVVARPMATFSLAADHRATDGHTGSRFLATVAQYLQHPEEL